MDKTMLYFGAYISEMCRMFGGDGSFASFLFTNGVDFFAG